MGPSRSGVGGLMGGPGVWVAWGGLLCDASFFCCCARLRGRADAWGRGVGGIRARKKGTIAFFIAGAPSTRISSGCHRARLGRLKPANELLALLRQPRRKRRASRWPRTPGKAKLSEPHGARRARSFRAHRRRALFHLRARGPRGAPTLLKNGRLGRGRLRYP